MTQQELVRRALEEDLGPGDITSRACVPEGAQGLGEIVAKQKLVLSGLPLAQEAFALRGAVLSPAASEGERLLPGQRVAQLEGPLRGILEAERVALNFLMRLSGIATHTASIVAAAQGQMRVVDTRKTTPLHRQAERAAVRHGGGYNHRFALFDGVLIKENHILAAGGLRQAVEGARRESHHLIKIQVEVETLPQLEEALALGVDAVLLDNMSDVELHQAARLCRGRALSEASGNLNAERIARLAAAPDRPDQVSVGGLVHQARWVDLSLRLTERETP